MIYRYLLKFGRVSNYLGYNALDDHFLVSFCLRLFGLVKYLFIFHLFFEKVLTLKPNEDCDDFHCRKRQAEQKLKEPLPEEVVTVSNDNEVTHESNEWGNILC